MTAPPMRIEPWLQRNGIAHGFFGRKGGVSEGIFESLNCGPGSGDERMHVIENRRRVAAALAPSAQLVTVAQVHGAKVLTVTQPWPIGEMPEDDTGLIPQGDGMVTREPDIALGILAADCAPVLMADATARVIGAAHAGWKGAFGGVLEATISSMEGLGASRSRIVAAVGPSISGPSYEVGPEFHERFVRTNERNEQYFMASTRTGYFLFDLPAYVVGRLSRSGIGAIANLGACTYRQESDYFSYRRATHRGESDYGRNVSAILLQA